MTKPKKYAAKYKVKTLAAVARFFDVNVATVRYWKEHDGLPGETDNYNLHEIMQWLCKRWKSINIVYEPGMEIPATGQQMGRGQPATPKRGPGRPRKNPVNPDDYKEDFEKAMADGVIDEEYVDIAKYKGLNEQVKYEIHKLSLSEKRGDLVRSEAVRAWMGRLAGVIRGFGDVMERQFGLDGLDVHDQLCDRIIEQIPTSDEVNDGNAN